MAPNLVRQPPMDEVLAPQPMVTKDSNSHGSHSVISTYAKKESVVIEAPQLPKDPTSSERLQRPDSKEPRQNLPSTKDWKGTIQAGLKEEKSDEDNSEEQPTLKTHFQIDSKEFDKVFVERLSQSQHLNPPTTLTLRSPQHKESAAFVIESEGLQKSLDRSLNVSELILSQYRNKKELNSNFFISERPLKKEIFSLNPSGTARIPSNSKYENENIWGVSGRYETPVTTYRPSSSNGSSNKSKSPTSTSNPSKISTTNRPVNSKFSEPPKELELSKQARFDLSDFGQLDEDLADYSNLFHHQKSLEELAKGGKDVAVKEDWLFNGEVTSAVILMGVCSIITMLICFIYVIKRWRGETKQKKEGKQVELPEDETPYLKPHLGTNIYNPSSFLPHMSFLNALSQIASKSDLLTVPASFNAEQFCEAQLGRLWFSVRYDEEKSDLRVNVLHARYPNGRGIASNIGELWVEGLIITPMNKIKATSSTSTRRATQAPVFNHNFLFLVQKEDIDSLILKLVLHDRHPKKGECVVGSVILPFSSIDLSSPEIHCRDLL